MADLSDVYGQNFQNEARQSRVDFILNGMANNIGHRQFKFKLHDTKDLWDGSQNLTKTNINNLINRVTAVNKKLHMKHLDKNSPQINMLPELIIDIPIEYFLI